MVGFVLSLNRPFVLVSLHILMWKVKGNANKDKYSSPSIQNITINSSDLISLSPG